MDQVEQTWALSANPIAVTDASGAIFISNRPAWQSRRLFEGRQGDARACRAPGPAKARPCISPASPAPPISRQAARLPLMGWTLHVLADRGAIVAAQQSAVLVAVLAALLSGSLAFLYVKRREALRLRQLRAEASAQRLENLVRERTADLTEANAALAHEVGERTEAEEKLRKTQADLIQAAKLAALGQMSATLSHEYNQPLAAIRTYADNATELLARGRSRGGGRRRGAHRRPGRPHVRTVAHPALLRPQARHRRRRRAVRARHRRGADARRSARPAGRRQHKARGIAAGRERARRPCAPHPGRRQSRQQRRRRADRHRVGAVPSKARKSSSGCAASARASRSASRTTARAFRTRRASACSSRSIRPRASARASGSACRSSTTSCASSAARSASRTRPAAAPASPCCCRRPARPLRDPWPRYHERGAHPARRRRRGSAPGPGAGAGDRGLRRRRLLRGPRTRCRGSRATSTASSSATSACPASTAWPSCGSCWRSTRRCPSC